MSVRITEVEDTDRSFTLLAEQDVPVTVEEFDRAIGRPRVLGEWFGVEFTWPTCPDHQMDVGSALEFKAPVGPFAVDFVLIVADRVPGESLLFRTTRGGVDMTVECAWAPAATGVTVQLRVDFRVRGALWWKFPWTRAMSRRRIVRGLERMREDLAPRPARVLAGVSAPSRDSALPPDSRRAAAPRSAARRRSSGRRCAHRV